MSNHFVQELAFLVILEKGHKTSAVDITVIVGTKRQAFVISTILLYASCDCESGTTECYMLIWIYTMEMVGTM